MEIKPHTKKAAPLEELNILRSELIYCHTRRNPRSKASQGEMVLILYRSCSDLCVISHSFMPLRGSGTSLVL